MKKAYLTIDDAPSVDFAAKMEFLHHHGIPALLFCEGRWMLEREDLVRAAITRGFVIGNHSFTHPHFSDLSLEECRDEIRKTDELIQSVYRHAGVERPARYFRFPYFDLGGDARDGKPGEIQRYLRELGYRQPGFEGINPKYFDPSLLAGADVRCTYDQSEYWLGQAGAPWGLSTEAAILARIDEDFPYEGRALSREDTADIILVHDHENTTGLFYKILERYQEKGIAFQRIP